MKKASKYKKYFFIAVGLYIVYVGIVEFDAATNGIQLFRGLFWMLVGAINIWSNI